MVKALRQLLNNPFAMLIGKFSYLLLLLLTILFFYKPFFLRQQLPVPFDTVIGLYNPYRDFYAKDNPNGISYKNYLITDPVRQIYVWKELAVDQWKSGHIPLWNPYEMAGKPLLANFQSSVFYPLNLILLYQPFFLSWSVFIILQTVLAGLFMYLFLVNLKLRRDAAALGALVFCFSGFSVSWLEWGNVGHTALWLPLILYSIDKIVVSKKGFRWLLLLIISLTCSFLGGHLQIFFYIFLFSNVYFLFRWFDERVNFRIIILYLVSVILFLLVISPQLIATLQFISLSSRSIDQNYQTITGWFLPWQHLVQFVAPDFFGNPATLNYWGTWNYGELVGYVGVLPFIFALYSWFYRKKEVIFYWAILGVALLFSIPTGVSALPFYLHIPFISTSQPTRLIFVITFSLCVLCAFGFQFLIEKTKNTLKMMLPVLFLVIVFAVLWIMILTKSPNIFPSHADLLTAMRNLILPTILFIASIIYSASIILPKKRWSHIVLFLFAVLIVGFDLLRFTQKFTPFVNPSYAFPVTQTLNYLKSQQGVFRVAATDRRIMPPNFFTHYRIQSIEGYDPLYLKNYAEFIIALERNKPDISAPFGFNRIITPHNYDSALFDLLNVKYILSLQTIKSEKLVKVYEEGQTKVYLNKNSLDRAFFVNNVIVSRDDIKAMFGNNLANTAIITDPMTGQPLEINKGQATITNYSENEISIRTQNIGYGFLVLTDVYYPTWHAYIDGKATKIYQTDHAFRGIFVPKGDHVITFKMVLF